MYLKRSLKVNKTNLSLSKILCLFLLSSNFYFANKVLSVEIPNLKEANTKELKEQKEIISQYLLGPGDTIYIKFLDLEIFSRNYLIDINGNILFPELGEFKVEGLTKEELKTNLELAYKKYIKNPNLEINITRYRDVAVYVNGEIKQPGLYIFKNDSFQPNSAKDETFKIVRLFDLIKKSGGFNNYATLDEIIIIRNNSISQGGGKIQTSANFLKLIREGDQSQNITLYDGDYIMIKKSDQIVKEQIIAINKTNLSPQILTVFITGNVERSGAIKVEKGSSLNQALASVGGKKIMTGKIEFLSFNYDGSTDKRIFNYNSNSKVNSYKNPILNDGDVINVRKTIIGNTATILNEISSPILTGYGLYSLFAN